MKAQSFLASTLGFAILLGACGGTRTRAGGPVPPPTGVASSPKAGGQMGATSEVKTADLDNDGRPEVTKYYKTITDPARPGEKKQILVRQDIDVTWDGRPDVWRYFGDNGLVDKEEWDTDYDGKVDEVRYFEDGVISRSERDRNNDGRFDVVRYFKTGKLERKESDTNDDGKVDRWEYHHDTVLDRVGLDRDHDGTVDTWAKQQAGPGSAS